MSIIVDLIGVRFGKLTVIGLLSRRTIKRAKIWLCKCDCGISVIRDGDTLKRSATPTCGCWNIGHTRHGHSRVGKISKAYHTWYGMKARCSNLRKIKAKNYAGRGITVCERWMIFDNFLEDMGNPPQLGRECQIDRINNDLGYFKENCRWTTRTVNVRNRSNTVKVEGIPLSELSEKTGISYSKLYRSVIMKNNSLHKSILRFTT